MNGTVTREEIKKWLTAQAPTVSEAAGEVLAALWPLQVGPPLDHIYVQRQTSAGTHMRDVGRGLRYIALRWPDKKVRLYVELLQSGEVFLVERVATEMLELCAITLLPRDIRRALETYTSR